jgi:peptidyl-prolyl cis-trans isomerase B (cyclophilin B)
LKDLGIIAIIDTPHGIIKVRLTPESAPRTCANFVKLAERGFYDNLTFHRVAQNFVIQGGCPRGDGWGGPGYTIREEINPIKFKKGAIGMASSGRDTGGSQFFICLSDQPHLDGRFTAFGNVIEGWEILDNIEIGDKILSVKIEKGRL